MVAARGRVPVRCSCPSPLVLTRRVDCFCRECAPFVFRPYNEGNRREPARARAPHIQAKMKAGVVLE